MRLAMAVPLCDVQSTATESHLTDLEFVCSKALKYGTYILPVNMLRLSTGLITALQTKCIIRTGIVFPFEDSDVRVHQDYGIQISEMVRLVDLLLMFTWMIIILGSKFQDSVVCDFNRAYSHA
jgi:hypothetical protein